MYVDESGLNKYLQREHGRAPRGQRVEDTRRGRKFERTNVIGGMCGGKYLAVECYNHTTSSCFFEQWFENSLLAETPKGYTIIMDNASFHRKAKLYELAEKAGINLLFLPPYSPDFNPIECAWANLKRWLRDKMASYCSIVVAIYEYFWFSRF